MRRAAEAIRLRGRGPRREAVAAGLVAALVYELTSAGSAKTAAGERFSFCRRGAELELQTSALYLSGIFYDTLTYTLQKTQ